MKSYVRFAVSLALLTALAPMGTDMYLASMPDIARHFSVSDASVQLTLTLFLLGQGGGQLLFGPLVDRLGRRGPMLAGLCVFTLAAVWAGTAASMLSLLASRLLQGLAGGLLLVTAISSVRDVAEGAKAAKLFAILLTIQGLAPVLAPIAGGYIDLHFGWRAALFSLAGLGLLALVNSWFSLPESLPREKRTPLKPKAVFNTYLGIARNPGFLLPTLALASLFFYLFAYISGSAFLYQNVYGLRPDGFGAVFGVTGGAITLGAISGGRLSKRRPIESVAALGVLVMIAGSAVCLISSLSLGGQALYGVAAGFAVAMFGLGLAEPALVTLAMSSQSTALGSTAALMGSLQLALASLSTPLSGLLMPLGADYWFVFLLLSACLCLGLALLAAGCARRRSAGLAAEG
ncbi:MAG: Bcr/CflA family efflux MFS transporter [Deltaproteobacteria bacterium]|jgi:DHA1 family bicyclomycin/chloramphenicol resistance-like MFS transporter|nr:Bcr/CflA family efflux MFS transporter [Deltaproteobacteria bacterium]